MNLPGPKELAMAIAQTSLSEEEKREILDNIPYMSDEKILELYESLLNLKDEEEKYISKVQRVDIKYQQKLEILIEEMKKS